MARIDLLDDDYFYEPPPPEPPQEESRKSVNPSEVMNAGRNEAPGYNPNAPAPAAAQNRGTSVSDIVGSFFGELSPTSGSLDPILAALNQAGYGATRATHAGNQPSDDKINIGGSIYDLIRDVG